MYLPIDFFDKKTRITGIGSALVDILVRESDDFIRKHGGAKGGMVFADNAFIEKMLSRISTPPVVVPGGSACNTIIGIGNLGGDACFIGKCGCDPFGELIDRELIQNGVKPLLFTSSSPTGKVLSIITPDAQRTMFTFLGAASETTPEDIPASCFENTAIVHIEGYLVYNEDLMHALMRHAKTAGARVSLDLASYTIVEESKAFLEEMVENYVDILMANEDEARVFTGQSDPSAALETLSRHSLISVLKIGEKGSFIAYNGRTIPISPVGDGRAIDTTGAGDLWASGFLFGLVNGYPIEKCGQLGSACGFEVCQVIGAAIHPTGWRHIKEKMGETWQENEELLENNC